MSDRLKVKDPQKEKEKTRPHLSDVKTPPKPNQEQPENDRENIHKVIENPPA